jgi:glycerol-3-phosphate cytidylyltransferase
MFAGKKIAFTAGTWDLFHIGHLNMLKRATSYGDVLIAGISTDELVKSYKHRNPFVSYVERFEIVKALSCVDYAVKQEHLIDISQMQKLNVDVLILGDDWNDVGDVAGLNWMKENKKVIFLPRTEYISTSMIKHKLINSKEEN